MKESKALVMLSGGLDSATCLYWAKENFRKSTLSLLITMTESRTKKLTLALAKNASTLELFRINIPFIKESSDFDGGGIHLLQMTRDGHHIFLQEI